jgi:hypothetical protein
MHFDLFAIVLRCVSHCLLPGPTHAERSHFLGPCRLPVGISVFTGGVGYGGSIRVKGQSTPSLKIPEWSSNLHVCTHSHGGHNSQAAALFSLADTSWLESLCREQPALPGSRPFDGEASREVGSPVFPARTGWEQGVPVGRNPTLA